MSNGYHALKGFEYQATVCLDILLRHYEAETQGLEARPEGDDDMVLRSAGGGDAPRIEYVQVKKPRERDDGELAPRPWTLAEVVRDLLPTALAHLKEENATQRWILGDELTGEVSRLLASGVQAPEAEQELYLTTLHLLARNEANVPNAARGSDPTERERARLRLQGWRPRSRREEPVSELLDRMNEDFLAIASEAQVPESVCEAYRRVMLATHLNLPGALARIRADCTYGTDQEVRERVEEALTRRYGIARGALTHALMRSLRGFIQDIAIQPDRWIQHIEFDLELRSIWPRMNFVAEPPPLEGTDLPREQLVDSVLGAAATAPFELTGVSGAGKTKLAAAILARVRKTQPDVRGLYMEVRREHMVRDVLAGVAFSLRRFGVWAPFSQVVDWDSSDEKALRAVSRTLASVPFRVLVLLDLVDGGCSDVFARELAIVLDELRPPMGLVAFGQESAFRGLSQLERRARGIEDAFDLPGLDVDEFIQLVSAFHAAAPARSELWDVFQRVTAGRSAGLAARLAESLARCASIEQMKELAALPADEALATADRARYRQIPPGLRPAAERLVCFVLPFQRSEAEEAFPNELIGDAIWEMRQRGLLRQHDSDLIEMHETIRAGLERLVPPHVSQEAHAVLAQHYLGQDNVVAAIHHLERAGRVAEARQEARQRFLAGHQREALAAYVAKHRLLPAPELTTMLLNEPLPPHSYLLPRLFEGLGERTVAGALMELVQRHRERFQKDYRWAWLVTEAILACDPASIGALTTFGLASLESGEATPLEYITQAARRCSVLVEPELIDLFSRQPETVKAQLVSLLVNDARRCVLTPVLKFVSGYEVSDDDGSSSKRRLYDGLGTPLRLQRAADATEFLASLPIPDTAQMVVRKSVLLGRLESWIWNERHLLRTHCVALLGGQDNEDRVVQNALRILVFLGDGNAVRFAETYAARSSQLGSFAAFVPALLPRTADKDRYRVQLFDLQRSVEERAGDLAILLHVGADPDELFPRLIQADAGNSQRWRGMILIWTLQHPCRCAIPVLEERLAQPVAEKDALFLGQLVWRLGELPGADATDLLLRGLGHPSPVVRQFASLSMHTRRTPRALNALLTLCKKETNPKAMQVALMGAIASGPTSMADFEELWSRSAEGTPWRCILAGRLREGNEAEHLVKVATDSRQHWQVRRAAVLAATRLPFELALDRIAGVVLDERSPMTIDEHSSFMGHAMLGELLEDESETLRKAFLVDRRRFLALATPYLDRAVQQQMFGTGLPSGGVMAEWLYDRLAHHNWRERPSAHRDVLNELRVPMLHAAVLRGLRLYGRYEDIEGRIATADSAWLVMRLVMESKRGRHLEPAGHERIAELVSLNAYATSPFVRNILKNTTPSSPGKAAEAAALVVTPSPGRLGFEEIRRALVSGVVQGKAPLVLEGLTAMQASSLIDELGPELDYPKRWVAAQPRFGFTDAGFSVQGARIESLPQQREVREHIRPALAAANVWNLAIPWHRELLAGSAGSEGSWASARASKKYAGAFVACLAAQADADRFYAELEANGDLLVPHLADRQVPHLLRGLLDRRIVPVLLRFANAGTDDLLESLCGLAARIQEEAVDPLLQELFARWASRFNVSGKYARQPTSYAFWRAFGCMAKHPRFKQIPDWDLRLVELLQLELGWYHKRDIVKAIADSPRTYVTHEILLMRAEPFEHFMRDEVDDLDEAADRLFRECDDRA